MNNIIFNEGLMSRTISFCSDELDYHINQCECEEYHGENLAEIELLYRLGEKAAAEGFKDSFAEKLDALKKTDDYYGTEYIDSLKKELEDVWASLADENASDNVPLTESEAMFLERLRNAEANIQSRYEMEIDHCYVEDGEDGWYVYRYCAESGESVLDEVRPILTDKEAEQLEIDVVKCLNMYKCLYVDR